MKKGWAITPSSQETHRRARQTIWRNKHQKLEEQHSEANSEESTLATQCPHCNANFAKLAELKHHYSLKREEGRQETEAIGSKERKGQ